MEPDATCAQTLLINYWSDNYMVRKQSFYRLLQEAITGQIPMTSFDRDVFRCH